MRTDFPLTTIIKKFEGKATPADEQELQQWLGKDQANAAILTDIKTIWDDVQSKTAGYTPDVNHYWELMQRHISKRKLRLNIAETVQNEDENIPFHSSRCMRPAVRRNTRGMAAVHAA